MIKFKYYLKEQNRKDEYKVLETEGFSGSKPIEKSKLSNTKINAINNKLRLTKEDFSHLNIPTKVTKHELTDNSEFHKDIDNEREKLHSLAIDRTHGYNTLSGKDFENIDNYTGYSRDLNEHLHNIENPEYDKNKIANHDHHEEWAKSLSETLKKQSAPQDMYVYSGLKGTPSDPKYKHGLKDFEPGDNAIKARLPAFTSTSVEPMIAQKFSRSVKDENSDEDTYTKHILKIKIPKDSNHGLYIGHQSSFKWENEFLLDKNKKLHIHPEPEIHSAKEDFMWDEKADDMVKKPHKVHIWHAHIVD